MWLGIIFLGVPRLEAGATRRGVPSFMSQYHAVDRFEPLRGLQAESGATLCKSKMRATTFCFWPRFETRRACLDRIDGVASGIGKRDHLRAGRLRPATAARKKSLAPNRMPGAAQHPPRHLLRLHPLPAFRGSCPNAIVRGNEEPGAPRPAAMTVRARPWPMAQVS